MNKGLLFTSTTFRARAEIMDVRPDKNEVDIKFIPSDGNEWVENNWNLEQVKARFVSAEYKIYKQNPADKLINIL